MRADISFSKLNSTKLSKGKKCLIFTVYFLFVVIMATICAVYAYFTSKAEASGNLYFGEINVGFYDGENVLSSSDFKTKFTKLTPGDTLDLSNINIKNIGTHDADVLLNLDVEITSTEAKTLHYNKWYNVYGEEVNIDDFAANVAKATRIKKDESAVTYIKWKVPSEAVDNNYFDATANVKLNAFACQTDLEEAVNYVDESLYASYYICKNASTTAETTTSKNLFNVNSGLEDGYSASHTTVEDDKIIMPYSSGNTFSAEFAQYVEVYPNKKYTISYNLVQGKERILIRLYNQDKQIINDSSIIITGMNYHESYKGYYVDNSLLTLSFVENVKYFRICTCAMNYSENDVTIYENFQIEIGDTATEYEPYFEPFEYTGNQVTSEPLMKIIGKNLLNLKTLSTTSTTGFTYSVTDQVVTRTVTMEVASTSLFASTIFPSIVGTVKLYPGAYTWSLTVVSGFINSGRYIELTTESGSTLTWNENTAITLTETCTISTIKATSYHYKTIGDTQVYKIQIERGDTATSWEAYNCVQDTIDYSTMQVTRNIGKYEFKGTEAIYLGYDTLKLDNSAVMQYVVPGCYEVETYDEKPLVRCNYLKTITAGTVSIKEDSGISILPDDNATGGYVRFRIDVETYGGTTRTNAVVEFKKWLKELYEKGTPFTIWYKLETTEDNAIFTNKNLYQGPQKLHYETGATNNNTTSTGQIQITLGSSVGTTDNGYECGGDLFNYIYNKKFTVSAKVKHYEDDTTIGMYSSDDFYLAMFYYNSETLISSKYYSFNKVSDGGYGYYYITNEDILTAVGDNISNITQIQISLRSYASPGTPLKYNFEIKDIQIELGTSPTDYEDYDQTTYAYVNGSSLRVVGDVKDTYSCSVDSTTGELIGTITRNVGKYALTGEETWTQYSGVSGQYYVNISDAKYASGVMCVCSHYSGQISGGGSTHSTGNAWFQSTSQYPRFYIYDTNYETVTNFTNYLKDQNRKGNPIVVWYQLATATTETI